MCSCMDCNIILHELILSVSSPLQHDIISLLLLVFFLFFGEIIKCCIQDNLVNVANSGNGVRKA